MFIDAGGYRLAADVESGDAPPVVFISGIGEGRAAFQHVLPLLRATAATVTYDRAGIGDSGPRPVNTTHLPYSALAAELVALLRGVAIAGPWVVVAHSMGTLIARSLASREPSLVAGLVLVDGAADDVILWPGSQPPQDGPAAHATLLDYQAGAAELAAATYQQMPSIVFARTLTRWISPEATEDVRVRSHRQQETMADQHDAVLVVAHDSGHRVQDEAPALVAAGIDAVISSVAAGTRKLGIDPQQFSKLGGRIARYQSE